MTRLPSYLIGAKFISAIQLYMTGPSSNNSVSLSVKVTLVVEDKRPALTSRHTGQDRAEAVSHLWEKLGIIPFHNNQILEIHIAKSLFLVLGPIETDVRKYIFPNYASFSLNWNSGKNEMLSKILTGGVLLT